MSKALYATVGGVTHKSKKMYACKNGEVPVYGQTAVTEALSADNMSYAFSYANNSPLVWIIDDGQTSGELRITPGTNGASGNADILLTAKTTLTNVIVRNTSNESVARVNLTIRVNGVTLFDEAWDSSLTGQCWTGNLNAGDTLRFTVQATSQYSYTNYLYMSCDPFTRYTTTQTGTEIKPITRKIKKGYCVKGGVTHKFFGGELRYAGMTSLSAGRYDVNGVSNGAYAIFAGGRNSGKGSAYNGTMDAFSDTLTRTSRTITSLKKTDAGTARAGQYALVAGGLGPNSDTSNVDAFDASLTDTSATNLSSARRGIGGASAGGYALFAGGYTATNSQSTYYNTVDAYSETLTKSTASSLPSRMVRTVGVTLKTRALYAGGYTQNGSTAPMPITDIACVYNTSLTRSTATSLMQKRAHHAGGAVGEYALFAGGVKDGTNSLDSVEAYNASLTKSTAQALGVARYNLTCTTVDEWIIFAGGGTSYNVYSDKVDVYDTSLTKIELSSLSVARESQAAATIGSYALFAGGLTDYTNYLVTDAVDVYTTD